MGDRKNIFDEFEPLIVIGGLIWLYYKFDKGVIPQMEKAGASLYEMMHPDEKGHANDLPEKQLSRPVLLDLMTRAGFPDPEMAVAIALAESGGFPSEITDTRNRPLKPHTRPELSVGLFQINLLAHPSYTIEQMQDPGQNALAALKISKAGTDWSPWSVYKSGRYKLFLRRSGGRS